MSNNFIPKNSIQILHIKQFGYKLDKRVPIQIY